ncbi:MAG: K(+)-insensitive pyrophosphate-energized proton pump [Actinobacteria bacterium]|nr:K(+)-insensitive pyrophosphate-energized proton pump [Actinomycetota bacterium]
MNIYYLTIIPAIIAIIYSAFIIFWLKKQPEGDEKMKEISSAIRIGSRAFLNRQYKTVAVVAAIISIALYFVFGWLSVIGFLSGAVASATAGYIGMNIAIRSNSKTAEAARKGLSPALSLAFKAGSVTGFLVVALALLVVGIFYFLTEDVRTLIGLSFGASLISVFARLGGGIFTKAADVGADLVGKLEAGIPEDDPRNPAVIADNVGDNVGDCAGMAADLFETYAVTLTAAILLGSLIIGLNGIYFPLALGGAAILASVIGSLFVRLGKKQKIMNALYRGLLASLIISAVLFYPITKFYFPENYFNIYAAALIGLIITALMVLITDYYTAKKFRPVKTIAESSTSGHATNIIMGLAIGMEATFLPIILISAGILASFWLAGLYGIAVAAMAMLSAAGMIVAIDSFGPITDNAGGIAEMTNQPKELRTITDDLDAVGNTTKAVTKGYAIASAGLATLVLFASYTEDLKNFIKDVKFELQDPYVIIGLFLGAALPYIFGSITMKAVGKTAGAVVHEVRRQFKEIPGIMEGTGKPDYGRAVDLVTKAALKEMILPSLIPIAGVLIVGFALGAEALGGLLIGSIISGLFVAISMTSGGAAWDNAKKHIEAGNHGGKGSEAHKAAITGDTVGDPYKDTAGPAINPLIKVINIVALLIVGFLK